MDQNTDQRPSPQGKLEPVLQRSFYHNRLIQPALLFAIRPWWAAGYRLCPQDIYSAFPILRQPVIDNRARKTGNPDNLLRAFACFNPLYRLDTKRFQGLVIR
jgi:hypothetical protein